MNFNLKSKVVLFAIALLVAVFFVSDLYARGGRGRGGGGGRSFSRSGVASSGRIAPRPRPKMQKQRPSSRDMKRANVAKDQRNNTQVVGGTRDKSQLSAEQQQKRDDRVTTRQGHLENRPEPPEEREEMREDIQKEIKDRQDDRQEFIEDELDDHNHYYNDPWDDDDDFAMGVVVGAGVGAAAASASTTYVTSLPCKTSSVVVNGVSYYNCSPYWYQRSHAGGQVTYVVVPAPQGY